VRLTLIIADKNLDYLNNVSEYLRTSPFSGKFVLKSFSQKQMLDTYLQSQQFVHILLAQQDLLPDHGLEKINTTLILVDSASTFEKHNYSVINKYQSLSQLLEQVTAHFYQDNEQLAIPHSATDKKAQIISFYSASEGCGKTVSAVNLAFQLAALGRCVFYLNLDVPSTLPLFFSMENSSDFEKVLYYVKKGKVEQVAAKLHGLKKTCSRTKVQYIDSALNLTEMYDLNGEDLCILLNSLLQMDLYDDIIVDLMSSHNETVQHAFNASNKIYWLVVDDIQNLYKTKLLIDYCQQKLQDQYTVLQEKIYFICNKYMGQQYNRTEDYGLQLSGHLPYIPGWKTVCNVDILRKSDAFNNQLLQLHMALAGGMRGEAAW
jgi:cellulose biosynthesis protein BcsQ